MAAVETLAAVVVIYLCHSACSAEEHASLQFIIQDIAALQVGTCNMSQHTHCSAQDQGVSQGLHTTIKLKWQHLGVMESLMRIQLLLGLPVMTRPEGLDP